jgi:phospholipid/cholesterol/gamma-HCH transport system ATP-binding protein
MQPDIQISGVRKSFDANVVLSEVTCRLPAGKLYGLIGPSCGGKSVLLKIIAGIESSDTGTIISVPSRSSLMFQEGALFDSLNVFDNVAFELVGGRVPTSRLPQAQQEELKDIVSTLLARVGLAWALYKMPGELSGGMRRRVSLARALVSNPELVLLDDPTSGLDPVASSVIMKLVVELQEDLSSTMIIVSHDLRRLLPVVDEALCLFNGGIAYQGSLSQLALEAPEQVKHFVACRFDL